MGLWHSKCLQPHLSVPKLHSEVWEELVLAAKRGGSMFPFDYKEEDGDNKPSVLYCWLMALLLFTLLGGVGIQSDLQSKDAPREVIIGTR